MNELEFLDEHFTHNKARYLFQCGLATLCVVIILIAMDRIADTVSIASLGASTFIAFAMPNQRSSQPRLMVGGYLIGIVVGCLCYWLTVVLAAHGVTFGKHGRDAIFGGLSVGLTIFLMVVTESEHPPAAGLALGLVINSVDGPTVAVVSLGIITLALLKSLLKPFLVDLG